MSCEARTDTPPVRLLPKDRLNLVRTIYNLSTHDFEALLFSLDMPYDIRPASSASQANRAIALLDWIERTSGPGLGALVECLEVITGESYDRDKKTTIHTDTEQESQATSAITVTLNINIDKLESKHFLKVIEKVIEMAGNASITCQNVESGSVKLTFEGRPEDLARIKDLFDAKIFYEIEGIPIQSVRWRDENSADCQESVNSQVSFSDKLCTKMREKDPDSQGYIFSFLRSISSKNSYRKLIANYYFIYSALEEALENHREHPVIAKIYFPELCRVKSLIQDLTYYYGPEWQEQVVPSEATQIYVDRIREVSKTEPELLVAYSYGHYMSDLSGGQILKGIAQMSMNLEDGNGLAFYNFESINDVLAFKVVYRQCLNDISVSEEIAERILDETTAAFARFLNVHHASEGSLIKAMIQLFLNRMLRTNRAILFEHREA